MANHRSENRVSLWGYFGYGRPLAGFFISLIISVILGVVGIPYLSALFGIISIGFLYGVYKCCQVHGREGLNVGRSGGGSANQNNSGTDNPIFLELTATALARNHRAVPGNFPAASFPSSTNRPPEYDDQPPDYFEILWSEKASGTAPSLITGPSEQNARGDSDRESSAHFESNSDFQSRSEISMTSGNGKRSTLSRNESSTYEGEVLATGVRELNPSLNRLPSYDEATASMQQDPKSDAQYVDAAL